MDKPVFKVGDVVMLKGEDKYKMTITELYEPGQYRVYWLQKNGNRMTFVWPAEALKLYEEKDS